MAVAQSETGSPPRVPGFLNFPATLHPNTLNSVVFPNGKKTPAVCAMWSCPCVSKTSNPSARMAMRRSSSKCPSEPLPEPTGDSRLRSPKVEPCAGSRTESSRTASRSDAGRFGETFTMGRLGDSRPPSEQPPNANSRAKAAKFRSVRIGGIAVMVQFVFKLHHYPDYAMGPENSNFEFRVYSTP